MDRSFEQIFASFEETFPSEFEVSESISGICKIFEEYKLPVARSISFSKSSYRRDHPNNNIIFNANIILESKGKVWHGDLDITKDLDNLSEVATKLREKLYILYEHDARWGGENKPIEELIASAKEIISPKSNQ